ncbi:MAG: sigma-54 dependent transcriptional regulator [Bacteroidales bacterium]
MAKILVIDDERSIRNTLKEILEYEKFEVDVAEDGIEGLEKIDAGSYDVVLCDIKMPRMDGIEVLEKIHQKDPDTTVVMISGHGTIDTAVESIKKGAFDFISKPLDLNRLLITIRNATDKTKLVTETKVLKRRVNKTYEMIGDSTPILQIKEMIHKVAPTDARIFITGENGTGKELVARWIHELSKRSKGPYIEVNCAAIPSELIESELFGHEKGSFTSAIKQKKGNFELATGGTLFLDEIGDMSLAAQAKVLRALQESKISRVGGEKEIAVDVRVVAATNKDIQKEIENGRFREDLYHRLSVILIHVPTLNEREEDIPMLANHFLQQVLNEQGKPQMEFTHDALKALQNIHWTGNIRELRNVVERLAILCDKVITGEDVNTFAQPLSAAKNYRP